MEGQMKTSVRIIIIAAALLMPLAASAQQAIARIGSLSPQRAFAESAEGKAGIARLQALEEKQSREIAAKNKALQSQQQALEQNSAVLSADARARQTREVERFRIDVQRFIEEAQAELVGTQREIESAFLAKLRPAVEQVAKSKQLQVVVNVDTDNVVWADPAIDITSDVVKQLAIAEPARR
jgi:Skp family chaperone for outer membrane proteins